MAPVGAPDSSANFGKSDWPLAAAAGSRPHEALSRKGCSETNNLEAPTFWRHFWKMPAGSGSGYCFGGSLLAAPSFWFEP